MLTDVTLPKIENVASEPNYGRYHIEPLEPGFGVTVGNALRRVLLSSLPGAAVTSIKIDNVYHEFSAIPGVKEDTTELVLNTKQIRLRSFADRPVQLRIEASGTGEVTAADIIAPPDVEIINPELHLATLDGEESRLVIEMTVERGKGFVGAGSREGLAIGVIPIDAIYTPTRRVNYTVELIRVGQVTDYERLVLEVWTDGTMSPDEGIAQSSHILIRHFDLLTELVAKPAARFEKAAANAMTIPSKLYDIPIEDLDLTVRAYNCLKRAGIIKVGQVLEMSEDDLLGVRNFGRKSLDELRERLAERGFLENSRLAATSTSSAMVDEGDPDGEADEVLTDSIVDLSPVTDDLPPSASVIESGEADVVEIDDYTRVSAVRVPRAAKKRPVATTATGAPAEDDEEVPEYTYDGYEFENEEDEEQDERPARGARRRR